MPVTTIHAYFFNKPLVLIVLINLLAACSMLQPKTASNVEKLVAKQQFDNAYDLYESLPPEEQALVNGKQLKQQRDRYISVLVSDIKMLSEKNAFFSADKKILEGTENIPSSKNFTATKKKFLLKKQSYHKKYQYQHDLTYANFLLEQRQLLENLKAVKNDKTFNKFYIHSQEERVRISTTLGKQGLLALENKQRTTAKQLLSLAQDLDPNKEWLIPLKKINAQITAEKKNSKAKKLKAANQKAQDAEDKRQTHIDDLQNQFEKFMASGELQEAKDILAKLKKADPSNSSWLKTAQNRLNKTIDENLEKALKIGQIYYSKGNIALALKTWHNALSYAPNDEKLNKHIQRAEKFQEKFIELNNSTKKTN